MGMVKKTPAWYYRRYAPVIKLWFKNLFVHHYIIKKCSHPLLKQSYYEIWHRYLNIWRKVKIRDKQMGILMKCTPGGWFYDYNIAITVMNMKRGTIKIQKHTIKKYDEPQESANSI